MIRAGFSMESEKVGILEIGDIVTVTETRVNEANTTRVSFERGWTNATMTDGKAVLETLTRTHSLRHRRFAPLRARLTRPRERSVSMREAMHDAGRVRDGFAEARCAGGG